MRDLGYSLETAVADIIDNSIAAGASHIDIWCAPDSDPLALAIVDNGRGMTESELIAAMRPGSTSPAEVRARTDLGRFGLGLKTASFSQGRRLTVVSRQSRATCAAIWDLDDLAASDDWLLSIPTERELTGLPWLDRLGETGTLVVWEKLDRLSESVEGTDRSDLISTKLVALDRHLSLVFHRFIDGDLPGRASGSSKLSIRLNGQKVVSFDPFCRNERATQPLPVEKLVVQGEEIEIRPYILPHHSKLSPVTWRYYKDRSDFLSNQGAYVYRNGRLMAWGDWFRMIPKGEATKLARVQIDFPSTLDPLWTIDIKKSRAQPPPAVRERFKRIIERIAGRSVRVHRGRGEQLLDASASPIWTRSIGREGVIYYAPDFTHPLIEAALDAVPDDKRSLVRNAFSALGAAFPVDSVYADFADDPKRVSLNGSDIDDRAKVIRSLKDILDPDGRLGRERFSKLVLSTGLAGRSLEEIERLARSAYNEATGGT